MTSIPPFHQRFNIPIDYNEAQKRFRNRFINYFSEVFYGNKGSAEFELADIRRKALRKVAFNLGKVWNANTSLEEYIEDDFWKCLEAIEAVYSSLGNVSPLLNRFTNKIQEIVSVSEYDLGIKWEGDQFIRTGAKLLDDALVNESLKWLHEKDLGNILAPFNKALLHYSESLKHPEKLKDVITDMYEALEATAKWVTERDKDLSTNAEIFISILNLSDYHKKLLKDYIKYANDLFRHAKDIKEPSPSIDNAEAENFIYLTGMFVRFAIQKKRE